MIQRIRDALQVLQDEQAHSALKKTPSESGPAFDLGRAQGIYFGLQLALDAIDKAFEEDEDTDDRGIQRRGGTPYLRT